jgi:hypothetical protein
MRKNFTLIAFNLVTALATAAGVTLAPETATEYAEALVTIGGGIWVIINGFLIKRRLAKAPTGKSDVGTALGLILALLIVGGGLTACASRVAETPAQEMYGIERDFNVAQSLIISYFNSGHATVEAKAVLKKLEAAAYDSIIAAQAAVQAGNDPKIPAALAAARHAVSEILSYLKASGWLGQPPPKVAWHVRIPLTVQED